MDLKPRIMPGINQLDDARQIAEKPTAHTMGEKLADYVLPKCQPHLLIASRHVQIHTSDALVSMSGGEKRHGKSFNWRRPSFTLAGNDLHCLISPGVDYVHHYARLIGTACHILGVQLTMEIEYPERNASTEFIDKWLPRVPKSDVVILGYVERILVEEGGEWTFSQGFGWRSVLINGERVLLLGCEFSYWGDLAGALVTVLASRHIAPWMIYVGKLGTLNVEDVPNKHVATGQSSLVEGKLVSWNSALVLEKTDPYIVLRALRHVTVPSIIDETKGWYKEYHHSYDLVDPEIGRMAVAAQDAGVDFDYLHVVSDNLSGHHENGLYDERRAGILADRQHCLSIISTILRSSIGNHAK